MYDWLRRRVRLAPGPSEFHINNVDINAGEPIEKPPDQEFEGWGDVRRGEMTVRLIGVVGLAPGDPVPALDQFVIPEDLEVEIALKDLPPEAYTSASEVVLVEPSAAVKGPTAGT